jgi:c-di-GMP-related signal transduction protein
MDIFVARQPIFDRNQRVFGYELLYRSSMMNKYDGTDGTEASLAVIRNTFLFLGKQILTPSTYAFINFTKELLMSGVAETLPPAQTVIEILEDIEPDEELLTVCRDLKKTGYALALDDYTLQNNVQAPLLELSDILKVDLIHSTARESRAIVLKHANNGRKLLAEGVETPKEFAEALSLGYSLFQGYFFSKPVIVPGKDIPGFKLTYMRLLQELNRTELDFHTVERIIKQDMSLCYTLLKYINSAYFGLRDEITSIMQAMLLLGEKQVRKWASLALVTFMGADKPSEVVVRALIRGHMLEMLAEHVKLAGHESELFLMGIFSLLDVLMGRPLADVVEGMNLGKDVREALLGNDNVHGQLYELVLAYESGDWQKLDQSVDKLHIRRELIPGIYLAAIQRTDEIMESAIAQPQASAS